MSAVQHGVIFKPDLALAAYEGHKTQTRRIGDRYATWQAGDLIWVRETHAFVPPSAYRQSPGVFQTQNPHDQFQAAVYRGGWTLTEPTPWKPSIHMPKWACRTWLKIVSIRQEPLNSISEADAIAEGIKCKEIWHSAEAQFATLWDEINGPGAWNANPLVWRIGFEKVPP